MLCIPPSRVQVVPVHACAYADEGQVRQSVHNHSLEKFETRDSDDG